MILILGDCEDTLLYFKTRLNAQLDKVYPFGSAYRGQLGTEGVIMASVKESNYLSSLLTEALINDYAPYLIINLGGVVSFDEDLHKGDIFIADRYYSFGINYAGDGVSRYGQIPGEPSFYSSDTMLNRNCESFVYEATNLYVKCGFIISGEERLKGNDDHKRLVKNNFPSNIKISAFDNMSWGLAMTAHLHQITLLTIKVVGREIDKEDQIISEKRTVLEKMPAVGKIISRLVINLERI